jgi:hypothetical protein
MTMETENKRPLPESLHEAYGWTEAAGELEQLAALTGDALAAYAAESAANNASNGDSTVTADDIEALAEWLRGGIGRTY